MIRKRARFDVSDEIWRSYKSNFSRHLLAVTRHLQSETMSRLEQTYGHQHLRLGFEPYISLISERGRRPSELAQLLSVSRQACNQVVNQIGRAGYVARVMDDSDGRARQIVLTPSGVKLKQDGITVIAQIDRDYAELIGERYIQNAGVALRKLREQLGPETPYGHRSGLMDNHFGILLPAMHDYVLRRLMVLTKEKGHAGLKLSFGQVLTLIGESGGRIRDIAATWGVSKQAISVIARELQTLGYLQFEADPCDARKIVLQFSARGWDLIADSVASMKQLETEFQTILGTVQLKQLKGTFGRLFLALKLEVDVFEHIENTNIDSLALKIQQQLGPRDSRELARLLLEPSD